MLENIEITNSRVKDRVNKFIDINSHLLISSPNLSFKFDENHKQFIINILNDLKELSIVFCVDKTLVYRKTHNKNKCFIVVASLIRYRHFNKDYIWLNN